MSDEKKLKLTLAAVVVCWVLALLTYLLVVDSQAQLSGRVYKIPEFFTLLCQCAVAAGVAALSTSVAATIVGAYRNAFKHIECDKDRDTELE